MSLNELFFILILFIADMFCIQDYYNHIHTSDANYDYANKLQSNIRDSKIKQITVGDKITDQHNYRPFGLNQLLSEDGSISRRRFITKRELDKSINNYLLEEYLNWHNEKKTKKYNDIIERFYKKSC